jgi:hypothetical protein
VFFFICLFASLLLLLLLLLVLFGGDFGLRFGCALPAADAARAPSFFFGGRGGIPFPRQQIGLCAWINRSLCSQTHSLEDSAVKTT